MFKVYKFSCDGSIMALPISWVKNNKVPFAPNATYYIKTKKNPPKDWQLYEIQSLDDKEYDSYEAALKAEEILLEKSEVNTSDYEKCVKNKNQTLRMTRKKKFSKQDDTTSDESGDDGNDNCDLPLAPLKRYLSCHNSVDVNNAFAKMSNVIHSPLSQAKINILEEKILSKGCIDQHCVETAQEPQRSAIQEIFEQEEINSPDMYNINRQYTENQDTIEPSLIPLSVVETSVLEDTITKIVRRELQNFKYEILSALHDKVFNLNTEAKYIEFEKNNNFPLNTPDQLKEFEEKVQADEILQKNFRSYILQVGGKTPKECMKIISRIYALELQQKISYTGREMKKIPLKEYKHINILIETVTETYKITHRDSVLLLQKYLQQTFDRVRSAKLKLKGSSEENTDPNL